MHGTTKYLFTKHGQYGRMGNDVSIFTHELNSKLEGCVKVYRTFTGGSLGVQGACPVVFTAGPPGEGFMVHPASPLYHNSTPGGVMSPAHGKSFHSAVD